MLGTTLASFTLELAKFFSEIDPGVMAPNDITAAMLVFLEQARDNIAQGGEHAYCYRRIALIMVENLSLALRRDRVGVEVPLEQASILEAVYQKLQATKSGITGDDPDVERLRQIEANEDSMRAFAQEALQEAGLLRRVPDEAKKKIILSG